MSEELAYSFHLGRDKNKSKWTKQSAKNNSTGESSCANNSIQNVKDLSDVNNHNLRAYDNKIDDIERIYGTNNIVEDVKKVYINEFEDARIEYNNKQKRDNRKIEDYFANVSKDEKKDLACEIIIELGDMDFWNDKDMQYKKQMTEVFRGQVDKLNELLPEFKVANAVIHYDETSPHMHIVGVPVSDEYKTGMRLQVGKSKVFAKDTLTKLQDQMRVDCIERFNNIYEQNAILKQKQKGRNLDFDVKDMGDYKNFKKQKDKNIKRLNEVNKKSEVLDNKTEKIKQILEDLKPVPFNKNSKQISNEDIEVLKDYTKEVGKTTTGIRNVNDLNIIIENFETGYEAIKKENEKLIKNNIEKEKLIEELKEEVSLKDKIIVELKTTLSKVKDELAKFKGFWRKILTRFQTKIFDERVENIEADKRSFTIVADDLEKNGIFDSDDVASIKDISHKIRTKEEKEVNKGNIDKNRRNNLS